MNSLYTCSLVAVLSLASAGAALAHADLASADPAAGATVKTAPTDDFDHLHRGGGTEVLRASRCWTPRAARVDEGKAQTAPDNEKLLSVGLKPLAPGTYKVIWHATAADDSHKTKGNYEFTVKP